MKQRTWAKKANKKEYTDEVNSSRKNELKQMTAIIQTIIQRTKFVQPFEGCHA